MKTLNQELHELRALKDKAEEIGRQKKAADADFKKQMGRALLRMEAEESDSSRTRGYLYSAEFDRVKGQVEERKLYVRWALENDEAILEFLARLYSVLGDQQMYDDFERAFFEAIMSTSVVKYKEDGSITNQQARTHTNDGAPLPPGLTFHPDPFIGMRKS